MIDMAYRADVYMRFCAFKFFLGHGSLPLQYI
jgi:hypothetical protein